MPRSTAARKFGPLISLAAAQLLIVLLVPSIGSGAVPGNGSAGPTTGSAQVSTGQGSAGQGSAALDGTALIGGGLTNGDGSARAVGTAGSAAGGPTATGSGRSQLNSADLARLSPAAREQATDTSHCVAGRQFDPALDYFAPPCVAGTPGAAYPGDNGGATWPGVSATSIEIVSYIPDYGAEVDTVLKAQGLYYNADQANTVNAVFGAFLNAHYNLAGRRLHFDSYQGTCSTVPPDYQCLNGEMDKLVATLHPYAVLFSSPVCSACFAELARLKVVSTGGAGFSDAFRAANAPYVYNQGMGSTQIAEQFAGLWCHQLTSQRGSGRTATFAGAENPSQDFRSRPRVLGVIGTNDPDDEATVKNVLYPALQRGCGESVTHEYFYSLDVSTAAQQTSAGTAAMNTASNPATSVLCVCDPVAPQFLYNSAATNNYWPEQLIASNQTMDTDASAQTYMDNNGAASVACPNPSLGCPFDGAIGIGEAAADLPPEQMSSVKVFTASAHGAAVPVAARILQLFWDNYQMLASLIQNTGPLLTPARMQAAAPAMGLRGGQETGHQLRGFVAGQWSWTRDVRILYFSKHRTSPYDAKPGAWVQIEGGRKGPGEFDQLPEPPAPAANAR